MKQFWLLIVMMALVSSCKSNYCTVATIDGNRGDYRIISVRDSSVVVLAKGESLEQESIRQYAKAIPFDSIIGLQRNGSSGIGEIAIGASTGAMAGLILGAASYEEPSRSTTPQFENFINTSGSSSISGAGTGGLIGLPLGALIGFLLRPSEHDLYPVKSHLDALKNASHYSHGEPDWVGQIK